MPLDSVGSPALWVGFVVFVLAMLALDLGVFHRRPHQVSLKEAAGWSVLWVTLAGVFNGLIFHWFGRERGLEFTAGYLIEKALAVDNIFVFVVIFSTFAIPAIYQHRVLFWGVLGALVMRAIFIGLGGAFLHKFHWAIYVFGAILAVTGVKLLVSKDEQYDPEKSIAVRLLRKVVPMTTQLDGDRFFTVENGRRVGTPLLLALVTVEISDVIFAVDSIPAIYAVTSDPFIVFTSNIFAILGLRSMFFLLAGVIDKFVYLKPALSFVLIFVGAKMLLVDIYKVPIGISLAVIATILGTAVGLSMWRPPAETKA